MEMNASEPVFNNEGRINLKKARHTPDQQAKKSIPIDIRLGDEILICLLSPVQTPAARLFP